MTSIQPHGGTLIQRVATGAEREELLRQAASRASIPLNTWTLSDLDLIGVGAFSPLTGFLNEADYHSVVTTMRLTDGNVWSIPVTLAVGDELASTLAVGDQVALKGRKTASSTVCWILRVSIV